MTEKVDATLLRYVEHMPQGDDLTLIILKGHLRIIRMIIAHGDLLDAGRPTQFLLEGGLAAALHDRCHAIWLEEVNLLRLDPPRILEGGRTATLVGGLTTKGGSHMNTAAIWFGIEKAKAAAAIAIAAVAASASYKKG